MYEQLPVVGQVKWILTQDALAQPIQLLMVIAIIIILQLGILVRALFLRNVFVTVRVTGEVIIGSDVLLRAEIDYADNGSDEATSGFTCEVDPFDERR